MSELQQLQASVIEQAERRGQYQLERASAELEEEFETKQEDVLEQVHDQYQGQLKRLKDQYHQKIQQVENIERQTSLKYRQEVLTDLFEGAVQALNEKPVSEQVAFLKQVLAKYPKRPLQLRFGQATYDLVKDQLADLSANYPEIKFMTETIPYEHGFVLTEGKVDYNYLYRRLVQGVRRQIEVEFSDQLFSHS